MSLMPSTQRACTIGSSASDASPARRVSRLTRQIAAVDRRNVSGRQRRQRARVVPVEKMAAMPLQRLHRAQRIGRAGEKLPGRLIAEVVRRQIGEQRKPHVGRRRAMRDDDAAFLLHVVRRQPVVFRIDVGLEKSPRLAREPAQKLRLTERQILAARRKRPADPPRQRGRHQPQQQNRRGNPQRRDVHCRHHRPRQHRDRRRDPHRLIDRRQSRCCDFLRAAARRCSKASTRADAGAKSSMRHSVRTIASSRIKRFVRQPCERQQRLRKLRTCAVRATATMCCSIGASSGLRRRSVNAVASAGNNSTANDHCGP